MSRRFLIILFTGLLWCKSGFAQSIKNFTADPVKFIQELETLLSESNKKQAGEVMDNFEAVWNTGKFTPPQQTAIYRTANAMLRKRMKAFPDFATYLNTLAAFANSTVKPASPSLFDDWQAGLDYLLVSLPAKHYTRYMDVCLDLFTGNSLYVSPAVRWYATSNDYKFDVDSFPKIVFQNTDLVCVSKGDSSVIHSTHGTYYPNREIFYGEKGNVNWERAGAESKSIYANLSSYTLDITRSEYKADSVEFFNSAYFNKPLLGRFTDKILANVTPENASYPRFESYDVSFFIKNIVPDIDFKGGFSMVGNKMVGSGNKDEAAQLIFYKDSKAVPPKPFLIASSKSFIMRKDRITADKAAVSIYFDGDSIFHPSLTFKYIVKDRELALVRGEEGKSQSPYYDTYHNLDMYFDGLYWKIDNPTIDFKMLSGVGESKASFESSNYFRMGRFIKIQALNETHPLFIIKQYAERNSTKVIYPEDLAKSIRMPVAEVRRMFITLADQGFLLYDSEEDKAVLKDKLYDYLLSATGKIDYDVIRFESVTKSDLKNADGKPKPNASVNLLNFEMTMRGLEPIILSDSQDVVLFPTDREIKMKKNRDFTFSGRIKAGRFDFYGKQFAFDYQNFKIILDNVDSLRLKVEDDESPLDIYGRKKLVAVKSVIQNITGDLLVDYQGNKSGLHDYPQYPIFNSKKDSYVYYDKPQIQNGVYLKDSYFFHLDPFTIDSLDNFSKAGLTFDGEMVTAGIFPDFRDKLSLQPDLSLGLVKETGSGGWPAYGGKGTFTNKVSVSNQGLIGDGKVDYLASTTYSNQFIFLPDSMNTDAREFTNRKEILAGVEFPAVKAGEVYVHWMPKKDIMYVNQKISPMNMFENQAMLTGNLQLKPDGMTGNGMMAFETAELDANLFKYKMNEFDADTSEFRLTSDNLNALAFSTSNVRAHVDFNKRVGEFKSNGGGAFVRFPLNQYICFIDQFVWDMDHKEIEMRSSREVKDAVSGLNLQGSEFISIEPTQDSLRFVAPYAKYSLRDFLIKTEGVAFVQTADASVIPDSGKVTVERYAKMSTFENARIVANNTTKYHTIYNATVNILGRKKYEGSGDYDYIDENKIKQHLHFDKVAVDTTFQTYAEGEVSDTSGFPLSPMFAFKGNVRLLASQPNLTFKGFAMPNLRCDSVSKSWLRFTAEIDPTNVMIPVDNPTTDNGAKLISGIVHTSDYKNIYGAFLTPKYKASDSAAIEAKGYLAFNKQANEFRITSQEKMLKPSLPGNYVSLDDSKCILFAEGKFNIGNNFGQLKIQSAGNATHNWNNDSTAFNLLLALDFPFNDEAIAYMADQLNQSFSSQSASKDNNKSVYEKGLAELVGKEKADKLLAELGLYGAFKKMPEELKHTLFITDVKFRWDPNTFSFKSVGLIGIGSMDKTSVNRYVQGSIEIVYKKAGNVISIYLEPEKQTWFYFSYTRGLMQAISSQSTFNDIITKMKPEKRVNKEKDMPDFEYMLSTDRAVKNFLKKFNAGIEEEGTKTE